MRRKMEADDHQQLGRVSAGVPKLGTAPVPVKHPAGEAELRRPFELLMAQFQCFDAGSIASFLQRCKEGKSKKEKDNRRGCRRAQWKPSPARLRVPCG